MKLMEVQVKNKWVALCLSISFLLLDCKKHEILGNMVDSQGFMERATIPSPPDHLCIYYGYPSLINNAKGDLKKAVDEFSKFNLIVLGDGLWKSSHPDNANTQSIVSGLLLKKCLVFGYVDLGVSTNNFSEETLKQYINGWKKMGVSGIFFDDAGFDYKVTRDRQNMAINYCRNQDLKVFMNAWDPDDILPILNENDYYLAESFLVGHDKYLSLNDWKSKADKCYNYMINKGTKIACVATGGENINADFNKNDKFSMAWVGTALYNFHYFQATNLIYSANNNTVYFFSNLSDYYGKQLKQKDRIIKENETHFYRETDTHTLHIYGNSSSQGYGKIATQ